MIARVKADVIMDSPACGSLGKLTDPHRYATDVQAFFSIASPTKYSRQVGKATLPPAARYAICCLVNRLSGVRAEMRQLLTIVDVCEGCNKGHGATNLLGHGLRID